MWLGILKELSSAGIVHQDLKPAQILMVKDAGVRLGHRMMFADFDWAVLDGGIVKQVSTPGYATPEHMTGVTPTMPSQLLIRAKPLKSVGRQRMRFVFVPRKNMILSGQQGCSIISTTGLLLLYSARCGMQLLKKEKS